MPDYLEGIISLRGQILPVVDLAGRCGFQAVTSQNVKRWLLTWKGERRVWLWMKWRKLQNSIRSQMIIRTGGRPGFLTLCQRYRSPKRKFASIAWSGANIGFFCFGRIAINRLIVEGRSIHSEEINGRKRKLKSPPGKKIRYLDWDGDANTSLGTCGAGMDSTVSFIRESLERRLKKSNQETDSGQNLPHFQIVQTLRLTEYGSSTLCRTVFIRSVA